jgi:hypothetical protein
MKRMILIFALIIAGISLSSCQKQNDETEPYLKEYKRYKSVVSYYMGTMEKELSDTIKSEVDLMVEHLPYKSCMFCPGLSYDLGVEGNRKSLLWVADSYFKGKDSKLKYIFQSMFRLFYHEPYNLLLEEFNIEKGDEWSDEVNEYNNLPMGVMFEKYIEIEFND